MTKHHQRANPPDTEYTRVSLRLTLDVADQLTRLSDRRGISKNGVLNQLIAEEAARIARSEAEAPVKP